MTPLPILLAAVFLGNWNCSFRITFTEAAAIVMFKRNLYSVLSVVDVWPLPVENEALLKCKYFRQ